MNDAGWASGVRALFRLDKAPLARDDLDVLGLIEIQGSAIAAVDRLEPDTGHVGRDPGGATALLGYIDEFDTLASRLRLSSATPLALARAAWEQFGDDLPREMLGAWVFIRWDADQSRLTIAKSINPSCPILVARHGPQIALAPELPDLARLSWVSDEIAPAALATTLISYRMVPDALQQTILPAVTAINAGRVVRFDRNGETAKVVDPALPPEPWRGTFDDAVEATGALVRTMVREMMARSTGHVGVALSGGLDSTILSWAATAECGPDARVPLLTSAVAPGRGSDETAYARLVADYLGQPHFPVVPPPQANPYSPSIDHFRSSIRPTRLPFHFLNSAFAAQAQAQGVSHLLFGVLGELTLTATRLQRRWADPARNLFQAVRTRWLSPDSIPQWPDAAFATWLTPELISTLPEHWIADHRRREVDIVRRRRGHAFGYQPIMLNRLDTHQNEIARGRVRTRDLLTDIRLLRLFASMPASYADHGGLDRAIARNLLKGRVPESIRMRPKGPAYAPDFHRRLREFAPAAKARLPLFREAGVGAWLDLQRLEQNLDASAGFSRNTVVTLFRTEYGMQMGEYLLWWLSGRPAETPRI